MMNDAELDLVVEALGGWTGRVLVGAWQPARDRAILQIGHEYLLMVPRGPFARLHPVRARPRNPDKPFSFQGALRARIRGPLTAVDKAEGDRIVDLWFGEVRLHLRITGRGGGLWLLEGDRVLAAYDGPAPPQLPPVGPGLVRTDPPRFSIREGEGAGEAAARYFGVAEREDRARQLRIQLGKALRKEIDRSGRLLENLEGDLDRASRAPILRRQADALAAVLHTIPRGASAAAIPDLEDPDRTWNLELDPARPASEAMERMYRQARRLDRAGEQVLERMEQVEQRLRIVGEALAELDRAELDRLQAIQGLVRLQDRRTPDDAPPRFVTWTGPRGEVVRVGRNERSNRELTFQRSRGTDWWMHLRGAPGAHVVIPAHRDQPPPLELLLAAAQIALAHAKVQEGAAADVQYTRIRDVRSIPGESTGRVRLANEKVLHVVRDRAALSGWTRDA